jgi:small subunit ribosomal protein S10
MKIRLYLKSFESTLLVETSNNVINALSKIDCIYTPFIALPIKTKKFCVIRSPHIDKDSREQFEIMIHKRFIDIESHSSDFFSSFLEIQIPAGVFCQLSFPKH